MLLLASALSCTEPRDHTAVVAITVSIDGDRLVRLSTATVEVLVEAEEDSEVERATSWEPIARHTLMPDPSAGDWPWRFKLKRQDSSRKRYSLTATARDGHGSVVGRAQAVRDLAQARTGALGVYFDSACYRRQTLCEEGLTCAAGVCVDASGVPADPAREQTTVDASVPERTSDLPDEGVAEAGRACPDAAMRACAGHGSRTPLRCENGAWVADSQCAGDERCVTSEGARGQCKPIADTCRNRPANVTFCDGESMLICPDLTTSVVRPCAENERCLADAAGAHCDCRSGFVHDASKRCVQASDCKDGGGCDPLTECSVAGNQRRCSACPSGYTGSGEQGCLPLLQQLAIDPGTLQPVFAPTTHAYRVSAPLLVQRVTFTPTVPAGTSVTLNGEPLDASGSWTSPVLKLGQTRVDIALTSGNGVSSDYAVTIERSGEQSTYIKASNAGSQDQFGFWVDVEGDTLLATAWFEDSAASGVNGDQSSEGATDSGAAYVFARDGDSWRQEAYLKPSDTRPYDFFGVRADLDGDTIVVGALHASIFDSGIATRPGAAYSYTRRDGKWAFTQRLEASDARDPDLFGAGVALQGDTLAIGAPWDDDAAQHSGAVYVFERSGGMWVERQKLKSSKPGSGAFFGSNLALDGDVLVVGAPDDNRPASRTGSAEIFVRRNGSWVSQQFLQPATLGPEANFGFAMDVYRGRVVVGAPRTARNFTDTHTPPGEVYVFDPAGESWSQSALLRAPVSKEIDCFGMDVVLNDRGLLIGASGDSSGARGLGGDPARADAPLSGAAYLFASSPQGWVPSAFIKPHNTDQGDAFGYALAMDHDTLVITANLEGAGGRGVGATGGGTALASGAIYVFH
ncbi:MAG TPA: cadherin-like beta sandwich domain-containing protein [Polyangiales bacterium]|nr:cadherin-like beta sandwich domain-containing protein [Polyangiales bacterium]